MESDYYGMYNYKGFVIWNPGEKEWIAEPEWKNETACENVRGYLPRHSTIAKAKKWIREEGVKLKEEDYI